MTELIAAPAKGKRGLRTKVLYLASMGHSQSEIAKMLGCSRTNVHQILKRKGMTRDALVQRHTRTLEQKHRDYIARMAKQHQLPMDAIIRRLLVDAIDLAIEEEADLKCKYTTNAMEDTPMLPKLQQLLGSRQTLKTLSGLGDRDHGSALVGTSSAKSG